MYLYTEIADLADYLLCRIAMFLELETKARATVYDSWSQQRLPSIRYLYCWGMVKIN